MCARQGGIEFAAGGGMELPPPPPPSAPRRKRPRRIDDDDDFPIMDGDVPPPDMGDERGSGARGSGDPPAPAPLPPVDPPPDGLGDAVVAVEAEEVPCGCTYILYVFQEIVFDVCVQ